MSKTPFADNAPNYWSAQLPAIPLLPNEKYPKMQGWQQFAHRMPVADEQARWLARNQHYNIGLPLGPASGLAIIDIDVEDAAIIERLRSSLPPSPWVRIGKKGMALAYRHNATIANFKLRGPDRKNWVEYLSTGNQIVLPGSIHPDTGLPYRANTNLWEVLDQVQDTPDDLEQRLRYAIDANNAKLMPQGLGGVSEGGRHTHLTSNVGRMLNRGLEGEALAAFADALNETFHPPLEAEEVARVVRDANEKWDRGDGLPLTDLGNAKRLVREFANRVRFETTRKTWITFDGVRWTDDMSGEVARLAKRVTFSLAENGAKSESLMKWAMRSQSAGAIRNMIELAKTEEGIGVASEAFDLDRFLLNTPSGVVDLRDGSVRPARPDDYLTKCTEVSFEPDAECNRWLQFLDEVFPNPQLRSFVKPLVGYMATGLTVEHMGIFALGRGRNGKGVMFNTIAWLLGSYSANTSYSTFMQKPIGGPTPEIAVLNGARLVVASEGNRGQRLDSALFKTMTGGDPLTARHLHAAPVTFQPQFTPLIMSNYMPEMDGNDPALWARVILLPFTQTFDGVATDRNLPEALKLEAPGILRWIVEGAAEYFRSGLNIPPCVTEAVAAYRGEMDVIGSFIDACCVTSPATEIAASLLYQEFERYVRDLGVRVPSPMEFGLELGRRGHPPRKSGIIYRQGLSLKPMNAGSIVA